ncbi:MAG: cation:dicarboxylate symporter family transporter [Methanomicrobiales archaeon]|jgi:Na+/H+-dicarboxylate symporter|nr:cation:dicarboxylase symporter family transporter [Methanoregulaceae archaeon]MCC7468141.1 cation:dicarboxylase symporter family transporter [Burkholderiaceae bacterium]NLH25126.1 cation:dicarboxylase symporter family transporter [Methanomicrobiales archaeon]HNO07526.1 cation:dicarboxylase symporter family transporter [Methanoregulaceae archaeon]HNW80925.1 cation:dicarboxylase symporter family transporter [Methanoregulaceae archaeon]
MKAPRISFTIQVFASLLAGILCGLFFGEYTQILAPFGTIFIGLMQVTIIPSVVIFIITGIGSIGHEDAKKFLLTVAAVLLLIWFLGVIAFFFMQFAFPDIQNPALFSTTQSAGTDEIDLIDLFIPSNPFSSLAKGFLPAIVLFCILLGFALIGDIKNRPFVDMLQSLTTAFSRITRWMMMIVPLGIFALTASTFGTLTLTQFLEIQVYLISTIVISLILILFALPLLIYSLTPFGYREILSAANKGVLMGFSTGRVFITLPFLTEGVASLFKGSWNGMEVPATGESIVPGDGAVTPEEETRTRKGEAATGGETSRPSGGEALGPDKEPCPPHREAVTIEEKAKAYSGILIPLTYTIPSLGVFIVLLFVLFTAWFYGDPFGIQEQAYLALVGVPSLFGSAKLSLQFILELMKLPADAMQLYLISNPFHVYFASALTCMSMFSLSAIVTAFLTGLGGLRMRRALIALAIVIIVLSAAVLGLRLGFTSLLGDSPEGGEALLTMKMPPEVSGREIDTTIYRNYSDVPLIPDTSPARESLFNQIRSRDVLRVGYNPDMMPLAYFNRDGDLVGYDIHMAYDLARTLNVSRIEFIPVDRETFLDRVNDGSCDIVMSGVVLVTGIVDDARYTSPYLDLHLAFVTKDYRKDEFEQWDEVAKKKDLVIGIADTSAYYQTAGRLFPNATFIPLESPEQFFNQTEAEALLTTAEVGTAMTLLHPFYDVAILQPSDIYQIPCVYVVSSDCDDASLMFLNYWLEMEEKYGSLDKKYRYWVLGEDDEHQPPRWSVIRDVLHWVE